MCGIVGYIGEKNVSDVLINGLRSLEYRGYDSAGVALMDASKLHIVKGVGKVSDLEKILSETPVSGSQGIGHTRWATHGGVTELNAHPHSDLSSTLVLVHNGIVENYRELRKELSDECPGDYKSETDTEVVAELLSRLYRDRGDMIEALVDLYERLRGSFALVIMVKDRPGKIYCVRKGSPLVVGTSENGETLCASDVPAILPYTQDVIYMDDGDIAELSRNEARVLELQGRTEAETPGPYRLGRDHGGQGRLSPLHAQGDQRAGSRAPKLHGETPLRRPS